MPTFTVAAAYFFAGYAAITVAFYIMSRLRIPYTGFVARALAIYISLLVVAMYGVLASIFLRLIGQGSNAQWATARAFKWVCAATTGVFFAIEDPHGHLPKTRPAVFIGNHQTELDVLMLGAVFPQHCSVTAKSSLKWVPALGWFMSLSGAIFLDRKNSKDARQAMAGAAKEIHSRRQSVYMFPEGTRSYSKEPTLLPFKKGAFHLAVEAGVPIVPIVVANYSHILWIKGLVFNSGTIPCKVLDPIPTTGLTPADVEDLARSTRDLMLKELIALTAKARGEPIKVPAPAAKEDGMAKASGREVRNSM